MTAPSDPKLFAVYVGGRAPRCNTELHDVVFVVGSSIEATYDQIMSQWFGDPQRVHIDSWMELEVVDGHRITLRSEPVLESRKLFFINLGAYASGVFTELHATGFFVATDASEVKRRAKAELLRGRDSIHTDDLFEVDDCIAIAKVEGHHVHLEPTSEAQPCTPNNGYHIIPRELVVAYAKRHGLPLNERR